MQKTKIEWCDWTWNPIKGLCPVDCKTPDGKSYCYARKIYRRFHLDNVLQLNFLELEKPIQLQPRRKGRDSFPQRVFVCSTCEIFHPSIPGWWRDEIFKVIDILKDVYTFIILTKVAERIDRVMPENVWLGVSVEGEGQEDRLRSLRWTEAKTKFVSFEPLFGDVALKGWNFFPVLDYRLQWIIVGRLTGYGNRYNPTKANIKRILEIAKKQSIPVFLKNNLIPIMGEDYVKANQKWPKLEGGQG